MDIKKMFFGLGLGVVCLIVAVAIMGAFGPLATTYVTWGLLGAFFLSCIFWWNNRQDWKKAKEDARKDKKIIQRLEVKLRGISPLHLILAELHKFRAVITKETGLESTELKLEPTISYSDSGNVVELQFQHPINFHVMFKEVDGKVVICTDYNTCNETAYAICDKICKGNILEILNSGKGYIIFKTGMDDDKDRQNVKIMFKRFVAIDRVKEEAELAAA